ncbi:MAG: MOSC domain-containing protein [Acidimicrobiales bacterium]
MVEDLTDPHRSARVTSVSQDGAHRFSKPTRPSILLRAGFGVEGDAHAGALVRHRSRRAKHPDEPNLRQVHLVASELHDELRRRGFTVGPGEMGENVTTAGIDLLAVPQGTRLTLGSTAVVEITGLRNPCAQLDRFQSGLMEAVLERTPDGEIVRKAGVMAIVVESGEVRLGDPISMLLPPGPQVPLRCV